jgi:GPH family glycoside/pentoside/hexuronide:cation symporter
MAFFFFIPADQYWLMVAVNMVGMLIAGPTPALVWSMYADCADYGEWKTGRRTTALIFSTVQFSHKFGLAVGAGFAGIMLSYFGFVANEVQSETALFGIRFLFAIVPTVLALLGVVAIYFYRIDSHLVARIEQELLERRNAADTP